MALSHKKKTAGRPPDWPEETDNDAGLASSEVIWEEMINSYSNARDENSKEVTLDADKVWKGPILRTFTGD